MMYFGGVADGWLIVMDIAPLPKPCAPEKIALPFVPTAARVVLAKSDVSSIGKSSGEPHSFKNDGTEWFNEFSLVGLMPKNAGVEKPTW